MTKQHLPGKNKKQLSRSFDIEMEINAQDDARENVSYLFLRTKVIYRNVKKKKNVVYTSIMQ